MWVQAARVFQFHVIELIRCDRTCQRSITIINKEESFTPTNSPLSHYFLLIFCLKESSRRDLSGHVKISFVKKWHFFQWLIPLRVPSRKSHVFVLVLIVEWVISCKGSQFLQKFAAKTCCTKCTVCKMYFNSTLFFFSQKLRSKNLPFLERKHFSLEWQYQILIRI